MPNFTQLRGWGKDKYELFSAAHAAVAATDTATDTTEEVAE